MLKELNRAISLPTQTLHKTWSYTIMLTMKIEKEPFKIRFPRKKTTQYEKLNITKK